MKIRLNEGEFFPYYELINPPGYGQEVDLPQETIARWTKTLKEFAWVQVEMRAIYENSCQYIVQPYDTPKNPEGKGVSLSELGLVPGEKPTDVT